MARPSGSDGGITGPRVRQAAERLFARHGYAAVSMRMIAADVGIGAGALYHYTPDKQTLLADMMETHLRSLLEAWQAVAKHDGPICALDAFARFHIRFHLDRPDAVFIAYMELRSLSSENFAQVEALRRQYEAVPEDIIRAGVDQGLMSVADVKLASMALIAMLTGVNTWFREDGRLDRPTIEQRYADLARSLVGVSRP
ncbi:MAG: TetR/AcrR family transcriptional regulator [Pseudomonadota bacterium]